MMQNDGLDLSEDDLQDVLKHKMLDDREEWEVLKHHLRDGNIAEAAKIFQEQADEIDDVEFMGLVLIVEELDPKYLGKIASHITSVITLDKMEADLRETIRREADEENKQVYMDALERVRAQRDGLDTENVE